MELELQSKLLSNPKMYQYLKENSYWIKYLNRNPGTYRDFQEKMKELYHERTTDKLSDAIDNIDIISSVLSSLK